MSKIKLLLHVVSDLRSLADSVQAVADAIACVESASGSQAETPATVIETVPAPKAVTLEAVRVVLAAKSHDGFTSEVRTLLEKHGGSRLSEINPANYAALLVDAEGLK